MSLVPFNARCCNTCIRWRCNEKRVVRGNPPSEIYTSATLAKCSLTNQNTFSESCCDAFAHKFGDIRTVPLVKKPDPLDEFITSTIDCIKRQAAHREEIPDRSYDENASSVAEEEDDLNGDAEHEFARVMAELGKAQERVKELISEGLDVRNMLKDISVEFMHLLDKAKDGRAEDQYRFALAFLSGTHGAVHQDRLDRYDDGNHYFQQTLGNQWSLPYHWAIKAAKQGHPQAEYLMGILERDGNNAGREGDNPWPGVDYVAAVKWFGLAGRHGHPKGFGARDSVIRTALGDSEKWLAEAMKMLSGHGVVNVGECMALIRRANDEIAEEVKLIDLDEEFVLKCISVLRKMGERGYARLYDVLGMMYSQYKAYKRFVYQDLAEGSRLFEAAALGDDPWGQYHIGICLLDGDGVERDDELGVAWLERSAEREIAPAQERLGECFERGRGVEKYPEKAFFWTEKAAKNGNAKAMHRLGGYFGRGYSCMEDERLSKEWKDKAKAKGYTPSLW